MRFAGSQLESFLEGSPNWGNEVESNMITKSRERQSGIGLEGQVSSAGVNAVGSTIAHSKRMEGQKAMDDAQSQGQMMSQIGGLASGVLGSLGGGGGGGSSYSGSGGGTFSSPSSFDASGIFNSSKFIPFNS